MIATFLVDGLLCDGAHAGAKWAAGWAWIPPIYALEGSSSMSIGACAAGQKACVDYAGSVEHGFVYERALMNSELVASSRAILGW